jgi:hypothetical protein
MLRERESVIGIFILFVSIRLGFVSKEKLWMTIRLVLNLDPFPLLLGQLLVVL